MDEQQPQITPPPAPASTPPAPAIASEDLQRMELERAAKSGAGWFYWIVGLTLINMILVRANSDTSFAVGLGITQLVDGIAQAIAKDGAKGAMVVALIINIIGMGIYGALGWAAGSKRQVWAYVLGMVLFAVDSLIFIVAQDWIGIIFHALVLFWMMPGLKALKALNALDNRPAQAPVVVPSVAPATPAVAPPPYQPAEPATTAEKPAEDEPQRETLV